MTPEPTTGRPHRAALPTAAGLCAGTVAPRR
jgi:hypothetical protein